MDVPPQAISALGWAIIGPPLIIYAATRVRRGSVRLHAVLMGLWVAAELAVFISFGFLRNPSSRRAALEGLVVFQIHLFFAVSTLAGMAWQVGSRLHPRLRPWHRRTGPWVVAVWCAALWTGIYNYVYLYVLES